MKKAEERFWAKVDRRGHGGCWEWNAARDDKGYGRFMSGTQQYAHRQSWEFANGQIPSGLCVLHRCDNPSCVRPGHLFLGTQADNLADMDAKGRRVTPDRRGERNGRSKLTPSTVRLMRVLRDAGLTFSLLGRAFGVGISTAARVCSGNSWKHVKRQQETI